MVYIPIAFVMQTDVEYHDVFREIMIQLFESIRNPANGKDKDGNKIEMSFEARAKIAFADFIAHTAFLKTIPCPTFNTTYHIEFFNKTLVIDNGPFYQIPDSNQIPIKVLFEVLDF